MGKLDVKINNNSGTVNVNMAGTIDEDVDFTQFNLGEAQQIDLDLSGIKSINSCGIREWIKWIS